MSDQFSYTWLLQSLQSCSERLKKNKRNLSKVIPQVTSELDQLLFTVRQNTMNNVCPSSRVYEAQILMNKAVVKRHAGHHLEEAQCYLSADSIWVAVERERRAVNYPTSDDALARSVLCSAMACNVLLNNRYPAGQNPIPRRLMGTAGENITSDPGTYTTNLLWCPHLSRAWAVCYRLANVLTEFNCIEMAADYYELAAIIVSVDVNGNDDGESTHPPGGKTHADPNAPIRSSSILGGSRAPSVANAPPSTASGAPSSGSSREPSLYGRSAASGNKSSAGTRKGAKAASTIGIAPGFLYHYVLALLCCARTCVLIQDYPRALSVIDELASYAEYVQNELREHIEGKIWKVNRAADQAERLSQIPQALNTVPDALVGGDNYVSSPPIGDEGADDEAQARTFLDSMPAEVENASSSRPTELLGSVPTVSDPEPKAEGGASPPTPPPKAATKVTDASHHMFTLLELGSALTQVRVMKFCIAVILNESDAAAVTQEQITYLKKLSEVWRIHTDQTCRVGLWAARMPKVGHSSAAAAPSTAESQHSSAINQANDTARNLQRLATTMEMVVEESGWASNEKAAPFVPTRQRLSRKVLEACEKDMILLLGMMGIRSRDVTVLIHRMHLSLITNKLIASPYESGQGKAARSSVAIGSFAAPPPTVETPNPQL